MKTLGTDTGFASAFLVKTPKVQTTKVKKKKSVSETKSQLKASALQKKKSTR